MNLCFPPHYHHCHSFANLQFICHTLLPFHLLLSLFSSHHHVLCASPCISIILIPSTSFFLSFFLFTIIHFSSQPTNLTNLCTFIQSLYFPKPLQSSTNSPISVLRIQSFLLHVLYHISMFIYVFKTINSFFLILEILFSRVNGQSNYDQDKNFKIRLHSKHAISPFFFSQQVINKTETKATFKSHAFDK